jgi:threonine/homoserine/homoserine lactone efflux protein
MQTTLTLASTAALFGSMLVLALVPSVSVLTVSARSAAYGLSHGAAAALGIVAGDLIFVLVAVFGLALLAETMGDAFRWLRYAGGVYLIVLGIGLWRARANDATAGAAKNASLPASFMSGLLVTLADQKAILFYLGFFPAFFDLAALTRTDLAIVAAVTVFAVGGAKLAYAVAARGAGRIVGSHAGTALNALAAAIMVAVGMALLATG